MEELIITKRKLPHYFLPLQTYFITFRLKGTYPIDYNTHNLAAYLAFDEKRDILTNKSNLLSEDAPAKIVGNSLKFYDKKEYNLRCFCIMPNHVHVIFTLLEGSRNLSKIMQSIKRFTALDITKIKMQTGSIWQPESYDHIISGEDELYKTIHYVINNPVKAGLVDNWEDWKFTFLADNLPLLITKL